MSGVLCRNCMATKAKATTFLILARVAIMLFCFSYPRLHENMPLLIVTVFIRDNGPI